MIELRAVSKNFGAFTALKRIDLAVRAGEFMTFLGPSGCGKTTCLRLIAGFEQPSSGEIWLDNRDVTFTPPYARDVNKVFQSYALFPHLSVFENIAFGLKMKRLARADIGRRVGRAMEIVALAGLDARMPSELSGGQRQRVALARAIVCEPKVLLLDEPLSALDARLRQQMQVELKDLQKRLGITFVYVTHDQEEALVMSDRIAVMNLGKIEQLGTPAEIYHRPRTRFVATFIGDTNLLDAAVIANENGCAVCQTDDGLQLRIADAGRATGRVQISIRPEKIHVTRERAAGENTFVAHIEQQIFKGALNELTVQTGGGATLKVVVRNDGSNAAAVAHTDEVFCRIDPTDAVILAQKI
jgi:spermidine/putrescine transport system ATP-binding protein